MDNRDQRRRFKRHPVRWKTAVVFDRTQNKPILHTETRDLSLGGAAVFSEYDDLTGCYVTLLLAHPPAGDGEMPKMVKARARVVSSVAVPDASGCRHGLSFERTQGDGLDMLAQLLTAIEAASPAEAASAAAPPAVAAAPAGSGRLAQLRQLALEKQQAEAEVKADPMEVYGPRINSSLEKTYLFLKELVEQLNVVKPPYPRDFRVGVVGVPDLAGLAWAEGRATSRMRDLPEGKRLYEQVTLRFRLAGSQALHVTRETPANEKLKQQLEETGIKYGARDERNERGVVARTTFVVPGEVEASMQLTGNFETGRLRLKLQNMSAFGVQEHQLLPEAVTDESLDELSGFILGESTRIGRLLESTG